MQICAAGAYSRENRVTETIPAGCQAVERMTGSAPDGYSAVPSGGRAFTAHELVQEGSIFLEELHRSILLTAELYRAGNEQEGNRHFIELTHGLEMFVTLTAAARQCPDFSSMSVEVIAPSITGLNDILMEIVASQEQQDFVLLTDLLEYELASQVKPWLETFTKLRDNSGQR